MPFWIDLFRIQLMPFYHYCPGSCADVKVTLPINFKTVESPQRIKRVVFLLQQPSPTWKEYSINQVKFYSNYSANGQNGILLGCEKEAEKSDQKFNRDELSETLKRIHEILEHQRGNNISDSTVRYDLNQLNDARFDVK